MGAGCEPLAALDAALAQVHRAFRRAEKPVQREGEVDFPSVRHLRRDRSELSARDLEIYVHDSGGRLSHAELAWFVPRFCELLAAGQSTYASMGWACALNCLEYADFPNAWPDDQVAAITHFVAALVPAYVADPPRFDDVENLGELLQMASKGGIALDGILDALMEADKQLLARSLALWIDDACFLDNREDADQPEQWRECLAMDAFWIGTDQPKQVCDWLVGLRPWYLFAEAAGRERDPAWQRVLSRVVEYCSHWPEFRRGRIPS